MNGVQHLWGSLLDGWSIGGKGGVFPLTGNFKYIEVLLNGINSPDTGI
jgi:hypothetical protein